MCSCLHFVQQLNDVVLLVGQELDPGLNGGQPLVGVVLRRLLDDQLRGRLQDRVVHDQVVLLRTGQGSLETGLVRLEQGALFSQSGLEQGRVPDHRVEDFTHGPGMTEEFFIIIINV